MMGDVEDASWKVELWMIGLPTMGVVDNGHRGQWASGTMGIADDDVADDRAAENSATGDGSAEDGVAHDECR